MTNNSAARLTTVALLGEHFFGENLVVRQDGSLLVTVLDRRELWYVPAPSGEPSLLYTFDNVPVGIVEAEPDGFYVNTFGVATLERIDLRGWRVGQPEVRVVTFDDPRVVLNGSCLIAPGVILIADSVGGLVWRVDGLTATARSWLQHDSIAFDPDNPLNPQPGSATTQRRTISTTRRRR
jgi:hypothetical protein